MLSVSDYRVSYGQSEVLHGLNFEIKPREIVAVMGRNGMGKTTLMKSLMGVIPSSGGSVKLDGTEVSHMKSHQRVAGGFGFVPQGRMIFSSMTVKENILSILELRKISDKARDIKLNSLLDELNIQHIKNSPAISLSGGERRRVEIARCLATDPKFILLDEPFAGIDPIAVLDIQKIIIHLASLGIGVLITDHNVRETLGICDRAYIVNQGLIFASGSPSEIVSNQSVKDVYLGKNFVL